VRQPDDALLQQVAQLDDARLEQVAQLQLVEVQVVQVHQIDAQHLFQVHQPGIDEVVQRDVAQLIDQAAGGQLGRVHDAGITEGVGTDGEVDEVPQHQQPDPGQLSQVGQVGAEQVGDGNGGQRVEVEAAEEIGFEHLHQLQAHLLDQVGDGQARLLQEIPGGDE